MSGRWSVLLAAVAAMQIAALPAALAQSKPSPDFEFYRTRVEPIFLKKKPGLTRCVVCHAPSNNEFRLERLSSGSKDWTEEQSRRNFEMTLKLVNPGDPVTSRLLQHPLAPEAGGGAYHSGGRQFPSKNDADWKVLAQWINGAKPGAPKR